MAVIINPHSLKCLRPNVYLIREVNMPTTNFELDFETISKTRRTVKESVTASNQVTGDIVEGSSSSSSFEDMFTDE